MRRRVGLIIAVVVIVVIVFIVYEGNFFAEKEPIPTFEPLSTYLTDDAQFAAPAETDTLTDTPTDTSSYGIFVKFYADTTASELSPKMPDLILPDFTDFEETYPITFGVENLNGRRVRAYNEQDYAEVYLTSVNGGVWGIYMVCDYHIKDSEVQEFQNYLADWTVPDKPQD